MADQPSPQELESFKKACEAADTPFLIETARRQANAHVKQGHDMIAIFMRELCNRLEKAIK